MAKLLIIYHSQTGNTEEMAQAVAKGARSVAGAQVTLKKALDATADDLLACDAVAFGSPTNFGYMSGALKDFFDRTLVACRGKVAEKPFAAFANTGMGMRNALDEIESIGGMFELKKVAEGILATGKASPEILGELRELGKKLATG
ncbi:MAG: flavodoxin domain-containing protein [Dehalococcoidia bacterium]|nr:flavodoxin domain-containing protein [Dehalococcoidia bacterium]